MNTAGFAVLTALFASFAVACTQETAERVIEKPGEETIPAVHVPTPPPAASEAASAAADPCPEPPPAVEADPSPAVACDKTLKVDVWRDATHAVHPGDTDIVLLRIRVTAPTCSDAALNGLQLSMYATQLSPQFAVPLCAATPCVSDDDFAFRNWKVKTSYDHIAHNGGSRAYHGWNIPQVVDIFTSFDTLPKGESLELEVTADLAENYVLLEEGLHFRAYPEYVSSDMKVVITDHTPYGATVDTVIINSH